MCFFSRNFTSICFAKKMRTFSFVLCKLVCEIIHSFRFFSLKNAKVREKVCERWKKSFAFLSRNFSLTGNLLMTDLRNISLNLVLVSLSNSCPNFFSPIIIFWIIILKHKNIFMLIRIQILDSAQKNKDPDPGPKHFLKRFSDFMNKCKIVKIFSSCKFFLWVLQPNLVERKKYLLL